MYYLACSVASSTNRDQRSHIWVFNFIHIREWDVINFNGGLVKPSLKLGRGWVIAFHLKALGCNNLSIPSFQFLKGALGPDGILILVRQMFAIISEKMCPWVLWVCKENLATVIKLWGDFSLLMSNVSFSWENVITNLYLNICNSWQISPIFSIFRHYGTTCCHLVTTDKAICTDTVTLRTIGIPRHQLYGIVYWYHNTVGQRRWRTAVSQLPTWRPPKQANKARPG